MKKLLTLLLFATLLFSCSSDDDNDDNGPETSKTESLKGQSFSGFFSKSSDGDFDMYRVYTFTSDKEVTEYVTKNSADGDIISTYKGTYTYKHPNLNLIITRFGEIEHQASMNDARNEFSYPISGGTLTFKKK